MTGHVNCSYGHKDKEPKEEHRATDRQIALCQDICFSLQLQMTHDEKEEPFGRYTKLEANTFIKEFIDRYNKLPLKMKSFPGTASRHYCIGDWSMSKAQYNIIRFIERNTVLSFLEENMSPYNFISCYKCMAEQAYENSGAYKRRWETPGASCPEDWGIIPHDMSTW